MSIRHFDLNQRMVFQDSRDVRTKNRKTFSAWFFPVGALAEEIVTRWINRLHDEQGFTSADPLFPLTEIGLNGQGEFSAIGLSRKHWKDASAIRRIFKTAFEGADLPYFNPHSLRNTLAQLGERLCKTPEEFKAWSQNLGHEQVLTTFTSYGQVSSRRQAEIIAKIGRNITSQADHETSATFSPDEVATLEALLQRAKSASANN